MDLKDLTANELAGISGVPQPTISRILKGSHADPRTSTLDKLAHALGCTTEHLRNSPSHAGETKNIGSITFPEVEGLPSESFDQKIDSRLIPIQVLAAVPSMGNGEVLTYDGDQIVDVLPLSRTWLETNVKAKPHNLRIITGAGDSMHPTFKDGDMLLVDISRSKVDIDGVYVLSAHDRLFIKRVRQRMDGHFEVSSDNPTVKTVDVLNGDHQIRVHGRVVWAWNGRAL